MMTLQAVLYRTDRLRYFEEKRDHVRKRYEKFKKRIRPNESPLSELSRTLSDVGRELSFYDSVIDLLEKDITKGMASE